MAIFKSADSAISGTGKKLTVLPMLSHDDQNLVPHCAFENPECPPGEPPRESIELRALVVH